MTVDRMIVAVVLAVIAVASIAAYAVYDSESIEAPSSFEVSEGSYIEWEVVRITEGRSDSVEIHTVRGVVADVRSNGRFTLDIYIDGQLSNDAGERRCISSLVLSDSVLGRLSERGAGTAVLDTPDGEVVCSVYTLSREYEGRTETDAIYVGADALVHRLVRQCDRWDGFEVTEITLLGTDMVRPHRYPSE